MGNQSSIFRYHLPQLSIAHELHTKFEVNMVKSETAVILLACVIGFLAESTAARSVRRDAVTSRRLVNVTSVTPKDSFVEENIGNGNDFSVLLRFIHQCRSLLLHACNITCQYARIV